MPTARLAARRCPATRLPSCPASCPARAPEPHITISITIIALFIVELVDAAGLLLVVPPRACSAAVAPHHHGYGAYMAPPPSTPLSA